MDRGADNLTDVGLKWPSADSYSDWMELFTGMVKPGVLVRAGLETNSENSASISAEFSLI